MQELYYVRRRYYADDENHVDYYLMSDVLGNPQFTPLLSRAHLFEKEIAACYAFFLSKIQRHAIVDMVRLEERRKLAGFSVLELAVAMFIATTLLAMALPNARTLSLYAARKRALSQVQTVASAEATLATCQAIKPPVACPVPPTIPAPGTITTGGYRYSFTSSPATPGSPMRYSSSWCSWPSGMPNATYSANSNAANGYPECSSLLDSQIGGCVATDVNSWSPGTNLLDCPSALPTPGTAASYSYSAVPVNSDVYSYFVDQSGVLRYDVSPNVAGPSSPLE